MSRVFRGLDDVRDVLRASIGNRVTIILSSGRILRVIVEAVDDDLLIASFDGRIVTINIDRIDAVVTNCDNLLGSFLDRRGSRSRRRVSRSRSRSRSRIRSGSSRRRGDFVGSRSRDNFIE